MQLHVIIAQRLCDYPRQYGLEDLGSMTEYDDEANPDFRIDTLAKVRTMIGIEYDCAACLTLEVDEAEIIPFLSEEAQKEALSSPRGLHGNPLGLTVLFGKRKGAYEGEFGLEAVASMTEHDIDANPDYLPMKLTEALESGGFEQLGFVELEVDEDEVQDILYPERRPLAAKVIGVAT